MATMIERAKALELEAQKIIEQAIMKLDLPENIGSGTAARLVECIVQAAMLRVADAMRAPTLDPTQR